MAPRGRLLRFPSAPRPEEAVSTGSLAGRALDDLGLIRATMERARSFTALPGWGAVLMGATAFVGGVLALAAPSDGRWLATWCAVAVVAGAIGLAEMWHKARRAGTSLVSGAGSRFAKALVPGLVTGMLLTLALRATGPLDLLPAVWLLCYGTAVVGAGAHSIRAVRNLGLAFMVLGGAALVVAVFAPGHRAVGDAFMMSGFGTLHGVFGFVIARHRDG